MFNYDWFRNGGLARLIEHAKDRCAAKKFSSDDPAAADGPPDRAKYRSELEHRTILYLKDGLTYEMKEMADVGMSSALVFECVPVDDNYKVGSIVIVVPFEDISRVEVFAVHPDDKPVESLRIGGFRAGAESGREA